MSPKRILVVDDEPLICQSLKMLLDCDFHQTEVATNGADALSKFEAATFDLVFTDYFMPGMKGDQLADCMKAHGRGKPIILLTGFPPSERTEQFDLVMLKPASLADLRQAIVTVVSASEC